MTALSVDARTATAVLTWLARRTGVTRTVVAGRFLAAAQGADLPGRSREHLGRVLARLTTSTGDLGGVEDSADEPA